ncbi:HAMP domain-containing histidine kinase [bacterium]|nr:HAMP domain-containing histidine kinase [bacterium]
MSKLPSDLQKKSTFHEIKNQVSVCNLYIEIIKKTLAKENIENDTVNRALDTISNSVKAIESSMQELKAQFVPVNMKTIYLSPLINDVFLSCVSYADGKEITFLNDVSENINIVADRDKLYSVLINLCKNAVEAIEQNGEVKIYTDSDSLYIENNGRPIPENVRNLIFEDGFTTKESGSGLGLMLVKKLLNSQHFDIELLSSNNCKTIFKIKNVTFC